MAKLLTNAEGELLPDKHDKSKSDEVLGTLTVLTEKYFAKTAGMFKVFNLFMYLLQFIANV